MDNTAQTYSSSLNRYNIKAGDKFKELDFLGFIFVLGISSSGVSLKKEHVSCTDEYITISIESFNNNILLGQYYSLVRM